MTIAVLLTPTPSAALLPLDGGTVIGRLRDQLSARGVRDLVVLVRPEGAPALREAGFRVLPTTDVAADLAALAELARASADPMLVASGELVAPDGVIDVALAGAGLGAAALTGSADEGTPEAVRRERGRVISAGSAYHRVTEPDGVFGGLVWVGPRRLTAAAEAWTAAAEAWTTAAETQTAAATTSDGGTALDFALVALVRAGVPVAAPGTGGLATRRVRDEADLALVWAALAGAEEDAARMRRAVKAEDDLFATFCVSSYSPWLVRGAARLGLSPTGVTWLSVLFAVGAAGLFATGGRAAALAGAVLLYLGFVLDCVDGQLARYRQRFSRFGGWLDVLADRGKEFAVYAGLAAGATRAGVAEVWPLAIAALTLQTVRHMTDGWYGALRDEATARRAVVPFADATDALGGGGRPGMVGRLARAANAGSGRRSWLYWVKRTIVFPIGERWLVIAVCAALFDARIVFVALLAWGALAATYTLAIRLLWARALQMPGLRVGGRDERDVALHRDDGVLARGLARIAARGRLRLRPLPAALLALVPIAVLLGVRAGAANLGPTAGWVVGLLTAATLAVLAATGGASHVGRYDWLVPALLRAAELLTVIALAAPDRAPGWLVFTLLGVVALYHYDLTARLDKAASPITLRRAALGWDGRLLVLSLAALAGGLGAGAALPVVMATLAGYLAVLFVVAALAGLRPPVPAPEPGDYRVPTQRGVPEEAVVD